MSEIEQRYSQIEKEALGIVWACKKFKDYVLCKHISFETDHKPLIALLSKAALANQPPRVLRFRLRLSWFSYDITHVPGKLLYTADTLSRAPHYSSPSRHGWGWDDVLCASDPVIVWKNTAKVKRTTAFVLKRSNFVKQNGLVDTKSLQSYFHIGRSERNYHMSRTY